MYLSRVPTILSLSQLDDENVEGKLGPRALVSQCAFQKVTKISVTNKGSPHPPRIRSFGELSELENLSVDEYDSDSAEENAPIHAKITIDADEKSLLELAMLALWEQCGEKDLFRYDVTACSTKTLPGIFGFVLQLNEGRASKKRPTEFRVDQVVQEFDESKFNFTKAFMQEVLFQFDSHASQGTEIDPEADAGRSPDLVMINVSPIEYGHVLLVPRVLDRLTQIITPDVMQLALQFTCAIGNPYFRLGYNSLGAYATINHLHFQGYYLMAPYPVERAPTAPLSQSELHPESVSVSELVGYPVRGWVFEMATPFDQALNTMARIVGEACMKLQDRNIPHNVLICDCGARVFLWPQCYAEKQAMGVVPEEFLETGVNPAAFEVAGHVILKRRTDYEDRTQTDIWKLLSQVSLTKESFRALTDAIFN